MTGSSCAVFGCRNCNSKKKVIGESIMFHNFPKDKSLESQMIRSEWIRCCNRRDYFNPDTSRICSVHFVKSDYERDLQNELLGLPLRRILKKTAVPTIFNDTKLSKETDKAQEKKIANRKRKKAVFQVLTTSVKSGSDIVDDIDYHDYNAGNHNVKNSVECNITYESETCADDQTLAVSLDKERNYHEKYKELLKKHNNLTLKYYTLKKTSNNKIRVLNDQLRYYKSKNDKINI